MSIVKGEMRRYSNFQLALGRLTNELSVIGNEIRKCRKYDTSKNVYRLAYSIDDSNVLLNAEEKDFAFKVSLIIDGKDHLKVRKKISDALKKADMENIKADCYKPNN